MLAIFTLILLAAGCSFRDMGSKVTLQSSQPHLNRVAVFTFQELPAHVLPTGAKKISSVPASQYTGRIDPEAPGILRDLLLLRLQGNPAYQLPTESELGELSLQYAPAGITEKDRIGFWKFVGARLNVEGLILGHVYRWRERKGRSFAVEYPASVAFDLELIRTEDGAVLWRGFFDKTQRSLLENLLDISSFQKIGGRWATARELAEEGIEDLIKKIPVTTP